MHLNCIINNYATNRRINVAALAASSCCVESFIIPKGLSKYGNVSSVPANGVTSYVISVLILATVYLYAKYHVHNYIRILQS